MDALLEGLAMVAPVLALALMLATVNEKLVEMVGKPLLKRWGREFWAPYVALGLGSLIAVLFGIDLFSPLAEMVGAEPLVPWAGMALSAPLVGAGSMFIHDVWPTSTEIIVEALEQD